MASQSSSGDPIDFLIVIMSAPKEHEPAIEVGEALRNQGLRSAFVTPLAESARAICERGFPAVTPWDRSRPLTLNADRIRALEDRYGMVSLRDLCLPEARLRAVPENRLYAEAVQLLEGLEAICERFSPRILVQNSGGELLRRTAYLVARRRGIRHVFLRPTPFPGRLTFSIDSEGGEWTALNGAPQLQDVSIDDATGFVDKFRREKVQIADVNRPRVSLNKMRVFLSLFKRSFTSDGAKRGNWNPILKGRRYAASVARSHISRLIYRQPTWAEPFVFYPIHVWLDSAITVRAPHFVRQHHLIATLADALPQGHRLYVKEHPITVGKNPLGALLALRKLDNVTVIDPSIGSHEVLEHARAVAVINSTAGFEALAYGKPVVVLGKPFYSRRGLTIDVEDLFELRKALARGIQEPPNMDRVARFFLQAYRVTLPGSQITPGGRLKETAVALAELARAHN